MLVLTCRLESLPKNGLRDSMHIILDSSTDAVIPFGLHYAIRRSYVTRMYGKARCHCANCSHRARLGLLTRRTRNANAYAFQVIVIAESEMLHRQGLHFQRSFKSSRRPCNADFLRQT